MNETMTNESLKKDSTTVFGFWVYLMTDFVLFASLFAVYAVLHANTFGGAGGKDIFDARFVLIETLILLTSSFTIGLSLLAARTGKKWPVLVLILLTAALGAAFVSMELSEFSSLIAAGHGPQQSGFLSAYFTLVGTHGLHVTIGLLWALALIVAILRRGLTQPNMRKLMLFSLFWHFLDIIWIFIFTFVYLLGII
ncbi:MAG: cytochrome o ubiquinol oxidase subunit [Parcubacteria group bacterium]|nr:cytochrome o ubiquinol oxidase subunit [Parcubacteria group bacterium]